MQTNFPGGLYDASLPGGRAGAVLTVHADRLTARTDTGCVFTLPYAGLRLEHGGATGRMVLARGEPDAPVMFSEAPGFFEALRTLGGGFTAEACAAADGARRTERQGTRRIWAWVLAGLAVLALAVPPAWRWLTDRAVDALPLSVDAQLGDLASAEIARLGPAVTDERVTGFAAEIIERLEAQLPPEARGHTLRPVVVENPMINAFALPGGRMALCTGLLKRAKSADMVAGVLAHETTHVTGRHGLRHVVRSTGVMAAVSLLLGDSSGVLAVVGEGAALAVLTSYSRDHETEADREGAALAARAGFDPGALPAFLRLLAESTGGLETPAALEWMADHPNLDGRIATLEAQAESLTRAEAPPLKHPLEAAQAALR